MKETVIAIVGPTAVGKTKLSLDLAKKLRGEIISGDSMQIYKGMNIGTGKVTETEKGNIPHYMIDIIEPNQTFSVAEFQQQVRMYIDCILSKNKLPILVGGSGLYMDAILYDYQFANRKRNDKITKKLEEIYKKEGIGPLFSELQRIDPEQAKKIHPNNFRRVIRALEIYQTTGKTMTEIHKTQKKTAKYNHILIGLEMKREILYNQINQRIDAMIDNGLINEVRELFERYGEHYQAMQGIGYKEIIPFIKGEDTLENCIELLKQHSRRYAKRQFTWFKNKMDVKWYAMDEQPYKQKFQIILSDIIEKHDR